MFTLSLSDPNFFIFILLSFFAFFVMLTLIAGYLFHFFWKHEEQEAAGITAGVWAFAVFILFVIAVPMLAQFHFKP